MITRNKENGGARKIGEPGAVGVKCKSETRRTSSGLVGEFGINVPIRPLLSSSLASIAYGAMLLHYSIHKERAPASLPSCMHAERWNSQFFA